MLSTLSFNSFYQEEDLPTFTDRKMSIMALLSLDKALGTKQIHKLLFLAFAEGMVMLPFKFAKRQNGPYSEEARDELQQLETEGLIVNTPEKIIDFTKQTRLLTTEGRQFIQVNNLALEPVKEEILKTIKEYTDDGTVENSNALERYCYKTFYLKPRDKKDEEYEAFIKSKITDALKILESRCSTVKGIEDLEEEKRDVILSSFDYIANLLQRIFTSTTVDQVVKGVLIKKVEEYIDKWGEILRLAHDRASYEDVDKLLLESRIIFKFINETAVRYDVFESVYSKQVVEFD